MKRPYIPLGVRCRVALRQLGFKSAAEFMGKGVATTKVKLMVLLLRELKNKLRADVLQLDHDPALGLREFNERTGRWHPDANDPHYLIYREKAAHLDKTAGKGGEQMRFGGDTRAIAKVRRIERTGKLRVTVGLKKKKRRSATFARINPVAGRPVNLMSVIAKPPRKFKWPSRELRSANNLRRRP